jgi:4-amino-4-deoxy-L-arabinose transferase-like glycosyltransferase
MEREPKSLAPNPLTWLEESALKGDVDGKPDALSEGIIPRVRESETRKSYYARISTRSEMLTGNEVASSTRRLQMSATTALALLLIGVVFFGLIRYRLRDMPLERDEGEYAYSGQLLLQGIPPYELAYNMKLPGIYAAYAGMLAAFGETPAGIHSGLLLVNLATILVVYFLTLKLFGRLAAVVAGFSFALLSTSISVMGFEAHATNFVILPALIAILLLLRALQGERWWLFVWSGLFSGIALLMKQNGIFFILFCLFYLAWSDWARQDWIRQDWIRQDRIRQDRTRQTILQLALRHATLFGMGAILPYAATCCFLYRAGVFRRFWFWTVSYAGEYSKVGLHRAVRAFLENSRTVVTPALPVWILAGAGVTALFWNPRARRHSGFIAGLLLFSFMSLCPGAYFRPHYFVLLLPVAAILVGIAMSSATEKLAEHPKRAYLVFVPALLFLAAFGYAIFEQRRVYFSMDPIEVVQATYGDNAFLPAIEISRYIRGNSPETARIAVLGSEPEIYFYAQRHAATGYLYMYSLIGQQKYSTRMRDEMMRELEQNRPAYLVYVDVWDSWGDREGGPQLAGFLARLQKYQNENFETVGVADIGERTTYVWGEAAKTILPRSSQAIYVLERKPPLSASFNRAPAASNH